MCQFCAEHGSGKKWYLHAENYTKKLMDSQGRESFIDDFFKNYERNYRKRVNMVDFARKIPFIKEYARTKVNNYFTQKHAGQVIPLEDAISICGIPGRVSVIDCPCQKYLLNKSEKKCVLLGTTADIVESIPEFFDILNLDFEDAVDLLKSTEIDGKVHTVWTFQSPYIGAICNCNHGECLLFHLKNRYKFAKIIMEGHEVASINPEICTDCGNCQKICQFNGEKYMINKNCYGCGVCRSHCPVEAIQLLPRSL